MKRNVVTVLCFLWGDWCHPLGTKYVHNLFRGVETYLDREFIFMVGADKENAERCIKYCDERILVHPIDSPSWTGCLPKLNAFNPELGLEGDVLVFDLDSLIVGDIECFSDAVDDGLTTRAWFKGIPKGVWLSGVDLLGFKAGWGTWLWDAFKEYPDWIENVISEGGRERFVYRKLVNNLSYWQGTLPNKYLSYKNHVRGTGDIPEDARIISCHGNPRPHEIKDKWIHKYWR